MRALAIGALVVGTIVASLGGARLPSADVTVTAIGLLILLGGAVAFRLHQRSGRRRREPSETSRQDTSIGRERRAARGERARRVSRLAAEAEELHTGALLHRIGELESAYLDPLEDRAREAFSVLERDVFAEVFSELAAGEVLIRRAWSASADGHREEALESLRQAGPCLARAVDRLGSSKTSPS